MGDILSLISLVLPRVPRCRCRLLALPHPLAVLVCVIDQVLQPVPGVLHTKQTVLRHLGHTYKNLECFRCSSKNHLEVNGFRDPDSEAALSMDVHPVRQCGIGTQIAREVKVKKNKQN